MVNWVSPVGTTPYAISARLLSQMISSNKQDLIKNATDNTHHKKICDGSDTEYETVDNAIENTLSSAPYIRLGGSGCGTIEQKSDPPNHPNPPSPPAPPAPPAAAKI